mgnify:CR=1 FL=1
MKTVQEILSIAVACAEPEEEGRVQWSAYQKPALELRDAHGWGWARIYQHFSAHMAANGRKMPGTQKKFVEAMSQHAKRIDEQTGEVAA